MSLKLPQNCTQEELDQRQQEINDARQDYGFKKWPGYPPVIDKVPLKESDGVVELVESGLNLLGSTVA